jgi:hypothetical protein
MLKRRGKTSLATDGFFLQELPKLWLSYNYNKKSEPVYSDYAFFCLLASYAPAKSSPIGCSDMRGGPTLRSREQEL